MLLSCEGCGLNVPPLHLLLLNVSQAQLKKTEADVQQMMQDRWRKVEEIRQCVELSRVSPDYSPDAHIREGYHRAQFWVRY